MNSFQLCRKLFDHMFSIVDYFPSFMGDIYTIACEFDIKRHDPCDLLASLQKANALSLAGAAHGQGYEGLERTRALGSSCWS